MDKTEQEQIEWIKKQMTDALQFIKDPSEAVQLAAVRHHTGNLKHIKNPSEAVKLAALRQNPWVIQDLEQTDDQQIIAMLRNPDVVRVINKPSRVMWSKIRVQTLKKMLEELRNTDDLQRIMEVHWLIGRLTRKGCPWPEFDRIKRLVRSRAAVAYLLQNGITFGSANMDDKKGDVIRKMLRTVKDHLEAPDYLVVVIKGLMDLGVKWPELSIILRTPTLEK